MTLEPPIRRADPPPRARVGGIVAQRRRTSEEDVLFARCGTRLVPFMVLLFTVNFLDRVNVGFAALTMNQDLGFSPATYGFGAGVFFVGYFAFQVPSNVMLARVGARRWICLIVALWGGISAATALVENATSFYVLRFLLGAAEAGLFPGMIFYVSLWFPHAYRGRFAAAILAAAPLSSVIGGPLSSVLLGLDGVLGFHGWQWLFLIEGLPASLLAVAVLKIMPDNPERASWLNAHEKDIIAQRLAKEDTGESRDFWTALKDRRVIALSLAAFGEQSALFGLGLWLPQMVQAMGFSNQEAGVVVVPPYALSVIAMILWGRSSDRSGERIWHIALPALLAAAGLIVASISPCDAVVLIALSIAVIGVESVLGPFWGVPTSFLGAMGATGGIAFVNAIGSLGGFVAPTVIGVLKEQTGDYAASMFVLAMGLLLTAAIVLVGGRWMGTSS
jgi:ACS family tartrate transporter-like MFS transporter